ncbi:hypothetical protein EMIT0194MI4_140119 [Pseudomonas sp. IT-194MI4]
MAADRRAHRRARRPRADRNHRGNPAAGAAESAAELISLLPSAGLMVVDSQDERRWRGGKSRAIVLFPRPTLPAQNKTETGHDQDSPSPCVPPV